MKKILVSSSLVALMATGAMAQEIGATFSRFDDNWLTVLRNGMEEYAATIDGLSYQQEDATDDLAKQIDQVKNFVAQGVDAIIVNIVDTSAGAAVSAAAGDTPLVYVNREPDNVDDLPPTQAFVASNEIESGTLSAFEVCKNLRAEGKGSGARGYLMNGQLSNQAAVQRSKDVHDVIGMDMCNFMEIIDEQTANWSRDEAQDLMTNWMSSGEPFDFVLANNDEMAIGAIQAMKAAGMDMADVQVGGVDSSGLPRHPGPPGDRGAGRGRRRRAVVFDGWSPAPVRSGAWWLHRPSSRLPGRDGCGADPGRWSPGSRAPRFGPTRARRRQEQYCAKELTH